MAPTCGHALLICAIRAPSAPVSLVPLLTALKRAAFWEIVAVPDIRHQCAAQHKNRAQPDGRPEPSPCGSRQSSCDLAPADPFRQHLTSTRVSLSLKPPAHDQLRSRKIKARAPDDLIDSRPSSPARPVKSQRRQIKFIDKDVDHLTASLAGGLQSAALGKQRCVTTFCTLNKALHPVPPQSTSQSLREIT